MGTRLSNEHLAARAEMLGEEADRWKKHHAEELAKIPVGVTVIINLVTGEYVTGPTWHAARDAFEQRFGKGKTFSHSYTVGRPIFVGGGLWLK
jgi:hypothetical protein